MRPLFTLFTFALLAARANAQTAAPEFVFPLIQGHGGVVKLQDAAQPPRANSKVVLDITSVKEKKGILEPLEKAARIANLYAQAGVMPGRGGLEMTLVFHGEATKAVLLTRPFTST